MNIAGNDFVGGREAIVEPRSRSCSLIYFNAIAATLHASNKSF